MLTMNKRGMAMSSISSAMRSMSKDDEMIVVDNGSTDGLSDWLRDKKSITPILNGRNLGVPVARNIGLQAASNDLILFLDSDIDLRTYALSAMKDALLDPSVGMVGDAGGIFIPEWVRSEIWGHDLPDGNYPGVNFIVGYCMALRRETIDVVGPFDEEFPLFYWEDVDYGIRVRKAGKSLSVISEICYHYGHSSISSRWSGKEISEVERLGIQRVLIKHEADCPVWAIAIADGASLEDVESLHRSLNEEHPNTILHVVSDSIPSSLPWRIAHRSQWYPDHLYRRKCTFSAGSWSCSSPKIPRRDDDLAAVTSPLDRRRF